MSHGSYDSYSNRMREARHYLADSSSEEAQSAHRSRAGRMREATENASREPARHVAKAPEPIRQPINASLARNMITKPPVAATEAHIVLVDNSGSNRAIADTLKRSAGYLHAICGQIAGNATIALIFFSDHCDGDLLFQEADYTSPGKEGEDVLRASIAQIQGAGGGDEPEAIECALFKACELDFGKIEKAKRFLYLVSDEVAHGMGQSGDAGCPHQKNWQKGVAKVHENFGSFQVVASGGDREIFNLQKQFIAKERLQFDLMDLATGKLTHDERCRLVTNALLLFVARNRGLQAVTTFLMLLVEKWLAEPQYGSETLPRARRQINDFCQYLDISEDKKKDLLEKIFTGTEV